jgi:predicted GNAT family acetyltransferase
MNFIHENNRIYLEADNHQPIAYVTFPRIDDNVINIDHTFVDSSLRGQGIAGRLMEEAVAHLRDHNLKARLTCSYAVKWFEEHPDCSDVLDK